MWCDFAFSSYISYTYACHSLRDEAAGTHRISLCTMGQHVPSPDHPSLFFFSLSPILLLVCHILLFPLLLKFPITNLTVADNIL